ncbi:hypothetical protein WICMUC_002379 [Wickerhamomyces mucosus]|uniref:F-box domain-containing protein n=1 Tax=Wickerhamomyces mucosus TaxID=1378264 RepID=A0A9P8PPW1_9ASCO|nr:hypothetical protein WICMUC_002379 [Wickerhamomyces mucosus]
MDFSKSCNPEETTYKRKDVLKELIHQFEENENQIQDKNIEYPLSPAKSTELIEKDEKDEKDGLSIVNTTSLIPSDNFHKYCYRHNPDVKCNKRTDLNKLNELQENLEKLPLNAQNNINQAWSIFSSSSANQRNLILQGILAQCCFPQLSFISQEVSSLIKIDFISILPVELGLKILCYLDCASLCNAAQVSKNWKSLADDDRVWHHMCEQHIDRKCPNCGWGLPLMHMKRAREEPSTSSTTKTLPKPTELTDSEDQDDHQIKRRRLSSNSSTCSSGSIVRKTRPWKFVYSERFQVERNWRKAFYKMKEFRAHSDGLLTLKYDYKYLFTGSYDTSVKIWDVSTGELIRTLQSHTKGVKTLVFDEQKLITGSLDSTIKVWNYHSGACISTYRGHTDAVLSVDFYKKSIVSGSADTTIKIWNVETRTCHALRGHTEAVNCVKIHPKSSTMLSASDDTTIKMWDMNTQQCLRTFKGHIAQVQKVIPLNLSKDYDLVRDDEKSDDESDSENNNNGNGNNNGNNNDNDENNNNNNNSNNNNNNRNQVIIGEPVHGHQRLHNQQENGENQNNNENEEELEFIDFHDEARKYPNYILSASLDNTIKLWDVRTGKCIRTQFGHVEGIWDISCDTFRIVSGAHDRSVKIWDLQSGKCMLTFPGHVSSVSCVGIGDSSFISGDDSGIVRMYNFDISS